jgi:hypothetical protein
MPGKYDGIDWQARAGAWPMHGDKSLQAFAKYTELQTTWIDLA